jgi:hypothetical protein
VFKRKKRAKNVVTAGAVLREAAQAADEGH